MEVHQIRYFVEVARQRNFTRAAERCHVSQPTLSQQIRKLEDELAEPLFLRARSGVRLTPFGEQFYPRALRILQELRLVEDEARAQQGELRGQVRIGVIPTIAPYLLPRLLEAMLATHPRVAFTLSEDPTESLLSQLTDGQIDLALLSPPLASPELFELCDLFDDELLITLPRAHPLANQPRLTLEALREHPLVLMKEAHCLSQQSLAVCHTAGFRPNVSIESSQLDTVLAMVELGLGLSFTPAMALPFLGDRDVVHRSITPGPVTRRIALAWTAGLPLLRPARAFVEVARGMYG